MSQEAQIRRVYEEWHRTVMSGDLSGLMVLYAENAIFESPTVIAQFPDRAEGILRGKAEIAKLFERNFANLKGEFTDLHRTGFFSDGRVLIWEYPRKTPGGSQVDLFESMDIDNGLIVYHRVYWGWQGVKALLRVQGEQRT
jgi:steroid Delta-isomerase